MTTPTRTTRSRRPRTQLGRVRRARHIGRSPVSAARNERDAFLTIAVLAAPLPVLDVVWDIYGASWLAWGLFTAAAVTGAAGAATQAARHARANGPGAA